MEPRELALKFIEHINSQNLDELCGLMSENHRFVDALGAIVQGREQMRQGWAGYFSVVPDYRILCEEMIEQGNVVAAFGTAGGTYCPNGKLKVENEWQVPAAWRIEVKDNLILEWRVYADNEAMRRLMKEEH